MMVTFVSQCEKNALNKTRRVLDAFANRIGDCTWQTVITNEGLNAVKKLLRKTASKNTAVSCHWLRSRSRSELVWIVGNRSKFNAQGIVPVNTTQKTIINTHWENDWHYLPLIKALTALAALFHDWGKASACFQQKLTSRKPLADPLRHEWVSMVLLSTLINGEQTDTGWLKRLADGDINQSAFKTSNLSKQPMTDLPNAACFVAWLVVSHHKLPINWSDTNRWKDEASKDLQKTLKRITAEWGYQNDGETEKCFEFPNGLPSQSKPWLKQLQKWAAKLLACLPSLEQAVADGSWRVVLHHARLSLMLGDHHYSSQPADANWNGTLALYANTDSKTGQLKQKLDEHLLGVAKNALTVTHLLPRFEDEPPAVYDVKRLKQKSADKRFQWQDSAVAKIKAWKAEQGLSGQQRFGFFSVNMAGTGCGKTLANAKIMQALSKDGDSLRYALALGLRTLTLQTGDEYRHRIGLDDSELAVLIGSRAILELHTQNHKPQDAHAEQPGGSESVEELWEDNAIDFDIPDSTLNALSTVWTDRSGNIDQRKQKFLYAPVLACTIDHLMAATETTRGGRYILPCLRLMSSDLVIDEIDDFDGTDLIAIGRLIHLAGMLGRKVMISSATIPPDLAEGYFNAYQEGWDLFAKTRDVGSRIGCAWIDEFSTQIETLIDSEIPAYRSAHQAYTDKKRLKINKLAIRRKAEIIALDKTETDDSLEQRFYTAIQQAAVMLHHRHAGLDPHSGKRVSFGVVRVANISPCIGLSLYLADAQWPDDLDIRVMAYHSQQILLLRQAQEQHLDAVLKRDDKDRVFNDPLIRQHLDNSTAANMLFILVATPIEEVGRDHDFDWAVVEPSSYRSIIQLAGRVLRHRDETPDTANIALLQYNLKAFTQADDCLAYCRPGYESENHRLDSHDLNALIPSGQLSAINALPRIQRNAELQPTERLADLEHDCIQELLTAYQKQGPEQLQGWLSGCWWLTALPQHFSPFRKQDQQQTLYRIPDEREEWVFVEKSPKGQINPVEDRYKIDSAIELSRQAQARWWLYRDYQALIEEVAEQKSWSLRETALWYGEINVRIDDRDILGGNSRNRLSYCDQLGLWK
ncbi:type I-F CRISPR-associated helicase Cas3f [Methylobacter sp.]|uniref:type I-F CRISPR-associated helicase Cas3f n=1 Tax=Methylobacter sp. TaxID=2051955 RepID=UPI002FDEB379